MTVSVLAFGIVREIFGNSAINAELHDNATISDLRIHLENKYPQLKQLASYVIAQDNKYADLNDVLNINNEIAIIPPVSGG